jgi:hypothetical protein
MKRRRASRKASVEYDSVISTCTSEVAVHTKTTPHALAVNRLFTVPLKVKGPKRSTAVDEKTGAGPPVFWQRGHDLFPGHFEESLAEEAVVPDDFGQSPGRDKPYV